MSWRTRGEGSNRSRKIALMRKATTAAIYAVGSGGLPKRKDRPKAVTLPSLATARQITKERPE